MNKYIQSMTDDELSKCLFRSARQIGGTTLVILVIEEIIKRTIFKKK